VAGYSPLENQVIEGNSSTLSSSLPENKHKYALKSYYII